MINNTVFLLDSWYSLYWLICYGYCAVIHMKNHELAFLIMNWDLGQIWQVPLGAGCIPVLARLKYTSLNCVILYQIWIRKTEWYLDPQPILTNRFFTLMCVCRSRSTILSFALARLPFGFSDCVAIGISNVLQAIQVSQNETPLCSILNI